jgi:sulfur-oxidizing protein SoxY
VGISALAAVLMSAGASTQSTSSDETTAPAERWSELQRALFPGHTLLDGTAVLDLEAPQRAQDAALVPLTITTSGKKPIVSIALVIDNNPGPLAGRFTFGEAADPSVLKVRMRVNAYTNIHAVAESADGELYSVAKFVKASGGCSAPADSTDPLSLQEMGKMRLKVLGDVVLGKSVQAQLMIRHPNFNGMQMDQVTRNYTPAHFLRSIDITFEGKKVLHIDSDIALSTDPVITFGFVPHMAGRLQVVAVDSKDRHYQHSFAVAPAARLSRAQ